MELNTHLLSCSSLFPLPLDTTPPPFPLASSLNLNNLKKSEFLRCGLTYKVPYALFCLIFQLASTTEAQEKAIIYLNWLISLVIFCCLSTEMNGHTDKWLTPLSAWTPAAFSTDSLAIWTSWTVWNVKYQ